VEELREPQPGGDLVAQRLAYLMLVQALRLHLAEGLKGGVGWLFALSDRLCMMSRHVIGQSRSGGCVPACPDRPSR